MGRRAHERGGDGQSQCGGVRGIVLAGAGAGWPLKGGHGVPEPRGAGPSEGGRHGEGRDGFHGPERALDLGTVFSRTKDRTYTSWQRSRVFLPGVRSSLKKKKKRKRGVTMKILGHRETAVFYWDLRPNI